MGTKPPDVRQIVLDLMHQQTERDLQVKVGASNFSQPCSVCLARDLLATTRPAGYAEYWLGAWEGHRYPQLPGKPRWPAQARLADRAETGDR